MDIIFGNRKFKGKEPHITVEYNDKQDFIFVIHNNDDIETILDLLFLYVIVMKAKGGKNGTERGLERFKELVETNFPEIPTSLLNDETINKIESILESEWMDEFYFDPNNRTIEQETLFFDDMGVKPNKEIENRVLNMNEKMTRLEDELLRA